jgi:hypothetical protein
LKRSISSDGIERQPRASPQWRRSNQRGSEVRHQQFSPESFLLQSQRGAGGAVALSPCHIRNNQFGFSGGGPIIKGKTFFFLAGEAQLAIAGNSILTTEPSTAWVTASEAVLAKYNVPVNPVALNLLTIFPANVRTGGGPQVSVCLIPHVSFPGVPDTHG